MLLSFYLIFIQLLIYITHKRKKMNSLCLRFNNSTSVHLNHFKIVFRSIHFKFVFFYTFFFSWKTSESVTTATIECIPLNVFEWWFSGLSIVSIRMNVVDVIVAVIYPNVTVRFLMELLSVMMSWSLIHSDLHQFLHLNWLCLARPYLDS